MATLDNNLVSMSLINKEDDTFISIEDDSQIELIAKALSSITRRRILSQIRIDGMDVSNIASKLKMTEANISAQIKKLDEAGLINCNYSSGQHGVRKISTLKYDRMIINF